MLLSGTTTPDRPRRMRNLFHGERIGDRIAHVGHCLGDGMRGIAAVLRCLLRLVAVLMACGLSCLLAGCGPEAQVIEPGYESLPRCEVQSEIPVEELDQAMLHDCDAEGVRIRFPDDWGVVEVGPVGMTTSDSGSDKDGEVTTVNWGIEGVGVTFRDGDDRRIWGSTEAARRKQSAGTR